MGWLWKYYRSLSPAERSVLFLYFAFPVAHNFFCLKKKIFESNPPHHPCLYKIPLSIFKLKCSVILNFLEKFLPELEACPGLNWLLANPAVALGSPLLSAWEIFLVSDSGFSGSHISPLFWFTLFWWYVQSSTFLGQGLGRDIYFLSFSNSHIRLSTWIPLDVFKTFKMIHPNRDGNFYSPLTIQSLLPSLVPLIRDELL